MRCMHEASMHENNCFLTLTYRPEDLPDDYSIHKEELQKFFKRLRKRGVKFRYFACGEYGEETNRPHYHAVLFGYAFPDKELHKLTDRGHALYTSKLLDDTWQKGHALIGDVTFQSCAYVARYVMKKRKGDPDKVDPKTGKTNAQHYWRADPDTGELYVVEPEFCIMSRGSGKKDDPTLWRKGLGAAWLEKYKGDTNKDFLTMERMKFPLPKYYDQVLEMEDELDMKRRKVKRRKNIDPEEQTLARLDVKRKVTEAKINQLKRTVE